MPDYRNYNLRQLKDALNSIEKEKYPDRTKIINDEILEREKHICDNPLCEIIERMDPYDEIQANIKLIGNQLEILFLPESKLIMLPIVLMFFILAITLIIYNEILFSIIFLITPIYLLYQFISYDNKFKNRKIIIMMDKIIIYSQNVSGVLVNHLYLRTDIKHFSKFYAQVPIFSRRSHGINFVLKNNSKIWLGEFGSKDFVELFLTWLNRYLQTQKGST